MHVPLPQEQIELTFGKGAIDQGERNTVERQVPGGIPGVFPLVWHRHDTLIVEVSPPGIASIPALRWWEWLGLVPLQPLLNNIVIELFFPEHPPQSLSLQAAHTPVQIGPFLCSVI